MCAESVNEVVQLLQENFLPSMFQGRYLPTFVSLSFSVCSQILLNNLLMPE
ncbi:hypothetical protein Sjap_024246 [Stephania japonica]|uniref:Uncharacterized protein n=1 Tax=Stephania japonica TaxID=461633 RepID=A0AAP0ED89_9MAGN